ncbi:hypothetical protein FA15DRAFT_754059 [Coprinopsis marcescibilis]|uniref:Uncharacterized protein n=1 Tax=Coprinopsis marcescibilis TaxID=230819 RepID=A0A5C3L3S5_COPMA|nr:hypothetical protein FA15DRAFT_754059 [Coprinopsis marcescibilis]
MKASFFSRRSISRASGTKENGTAQEEASETGGSAYSQDNASLLRTQAEEGIGASNMGVSPLLTPLRLSKRNRQRDKAHISTLNKENEPIITPTSNFSTPAKAEIATNNPQVSPFPLLASPADTFGRTLHHKGRRILEDRNASPYPSESPPHSRDTSRSRNSDTESVWATPRSTFYSRYNSSSSVHGTSQDLSVPSPSYTFGPHTPNKTPEKRTRTAAMYFNHLETPPPLPPLDHPAFQFPITPSRKFKFPTMRSTERPVSQQMDQNQPRASRSLPSVGLTRSVSANAASPKKAHRNSKQLSMSSSKAEGHPIASRRSRHTRSESKSSITSSRRSSAEFSAKNASLTGKDNGYDETWEVKVSKELLRLSFSTEMGVEG